MTRRLVLLTVLATLCFSACTSPTTSKTETRIGGVKKKGSAKPTVAPKVVGPAMVIEVLGPAAETMAKNAAALVGVPAPGTYRLAQAAGAFVPIADAEVTLKDANFRTLSGIPVKTGKDGKAGLPAIFSNATLAFVEATYVQGGARLTLSAVVPNPKTLKAATIDPASTLIAKKLSFLGRIREVDLGAYPAEIAAKLSASLAAQLSDADVAAAAVLEAEPAARALDALLAKDAAIKPALATAAGGETVAYKAIANVTPKIVVTPAPTPTPAAPQRTPQPPGPTPTPTPEPTPTPTPRPSGVPVIPTPLPTPKPATTATPAAGPTPTPSATPTTGG